MAEEGWDDKKTYALVVVVCDKTEVVKERMIIRALRDFMGTKSRGGCVDCAAVASPLLLGNVTQLSIADFAHSLVSHLPKLFPLFCAFCPSQKEDAAKKGTSSRKESPSGSP